MAELNTAESGGKKKHGGKKRSKKMSTKVDLTPMVDLAFLLITFFMLTTTLNKPNAMSLKMPFKDPNQPEEQLTVDDDLVLNLILDKDHVIYWYEGMTAANMKKTYFGGKKGVRELIYWKQEKVQKEKGDRKKMIVLIKNTPDAKYKDIVNMLDEMDITDVRTYSIQDIQAPELEAIKNGGTANTVPEGAPQN